MKEFSLFLFLLVFTQLSGFSQDTAFMRPPLFSRLESSSEKGVVRLHQDKSVESLIDKQIE